MNSKWIIPEDSNFKSIEFNTSGNYILIGNTETAQRSTSDQVYSGSYVVIDSINNIIELIESKMRMKIIQYNNDTIEFTLTMLDTTSKEYTFKASKGKEIPSTSKTDLLCKTWVIVKYETTDPDADPNDLINTTILFSKAGTYYVANPKDPESGGIAKWEWITDSNETKLKYTWDDEDASGNVTINELSNDILVITELDYDGITIEKYTLEPYSTDKKNGNFEIRNTVSKTNKIKNSFLRKR